VLMVNSIPTPKSTMASITNIEMTPIQIGMLKKPMQSL